MTHPGAGQPAQPGDLVDVTDLVTRYFTETPDPEDPRQQVAFGTSGHRGSSLRSLLQRGAHPGHRHRRSATTAPRRGIDGPLFLGTRHTCPVRASAGSAHSKSSPRTASSHDRLGATRYTPTPAISHAILALQPRAHESGLADGIVITPSHNPPDDGGLQVQPAERWPGRHRRHRLDPGEGERLLAGGPAGR